MTPLRVVIVDDEPRARKGLRTLLANDPEIMVVADCANGRKAVGAIETYAPDLVFLDIQMPDCSGFDVLERIDLAQPPAIIFVTAFDAYALKAFDVNAVDYLLKPFSDTRFFEALGRAKERRRTLTASKLGASLLSTLNDYRAARAGADDDPAEATLRRFFVRSSGQVELIAADKVDWIEALGYHVKLHTGTKTHLIRGHLGKFEEQLDPADFVRISRSAMVNVKRIERLKDWFHGDCLVVLQDGTELRASRTQRKRLESLLKRTP